MAFNVDIVAVATTNTFFRRVLSTGPNAQVVVMCIPSGGEIGEETHEHTDQVLAFVEGAGVAVEPQAVASSTLTIPNPTSLLRIDVFLLNS